MQTIDGVLDTMAAIRRSLVYNTFRGPLIQVTYQYGDPLDAGPSFPVPATLDRNLNVITWSDSLMCLVKLGDKL